jgi:NAD(P)-dependent dehydrogenase (short-subunit alcohol dehydrogenase family)
MIDYQLTGKTAIVTGGVSGIGLAVAQTLAASGARISVWDLKQDAVDATVTQLRSAGAQAIGIALDVTDDAAVEAAVQRTIKELDGLHVAVNNAGIGGPAASSGDYPIDGWQRVIDVNLTSVFLCQRAQIQAMRTAGTGGSIINMARWAMPVPPRTWRPSTAWSG